MIIDNSEVCGEEKDHALNFNQDMVALGFDSNNVKAIADGIEYKDGKDKQFKHHAKTTTITQQKTLFQKLIHDADCLDIIRMTKSFDKTELDIYQDLHANPLFISELESIIRNHYETIEHLMQNPGSGTVGEVHQFCEKASNCYVAVKEAAINLLLQHIS
jgi:hypothetical protein